MVSFPLRGLEDLLLVPRQKFRARQGRDALGERQGTPVVLGCAALTPTYELFAAGHVLADDHRVLLRQDGEHAEVEELVMQRAQCESVRLDVGAAGLEPLDMRGFEPDDFASEAKVMPADATAVLVGEENARPERRVAPHSLGSAGFQTPSVRRCQNG